MKRALFIDRDGTIIIEPPDEQIDSFEKLRFVPGVISALRQITEKADFELVMVTNQDGLGTESFPEETFWPAHNKMLDILKGEGVMFSEILIDRSFPEDNAPTRKPRTGLLTKFIHGAYDLKHSWVIGDRDSDMELAKNLDCGGIMIGDDPAPNAALVTRDWSAIAQFLISEYRSAAVVRNTAETRIRVKITLDGSGRSRIDTGLKFFDHMLDQLARHGGIDLDLQVDGDLEVDEHHTIEDTAIALGEAFAKAMGSKKSIARYGFLLPMDDALAQVAIDFGGRPWLVWDCEFTREYIGDMPTEMFKHFFKSFADNAKCNLNIRVSGDNEHHKIEAIFKGFAKSINMAIAQTGSGLPTTKGVL